MGEGVEERGRGGSTAGMVTEVDEEAWSLDQESLDSSMNLNLTDSLNGNDEPTLNCSLGCSL